MKINGNAIRPGYVIEHKGALWRATKIQHTQPGKGGAYLQVELRNLRDGRLCTPPADAILRPGPRVPEGVRLLAECLHPEAFPPAEAP